jgi:malonyl-CoA reductase/3-hydroxypropionate dehydrogenase (NADP+)
MSDSDDTTARRRAPRGPQVVITGAAGNIGSHISRNLLREGARLVMTGRNEDKLEAFVEELVAEGFDRGAMATVPATCADRGRAGEIVATAVGPSAPSTSSSTTPAVPGPRRTLRDIPFTEAEKRARATTRPCSIRR